MDNPADEPSGEKVEAMLREEAKKFASSEVELARLLEQCPPQDANGILIGDEYLEAIFDPQVISIPDTNMMFAEHSDETVEIQIAKSAGVNTSYVLDKSTATPEAYNNIDNPPKSILYFFDHAGNYASFERETKFIDTPTEKSKKIENFHPRKMTEGDFRDVGIVLTNMHHAISQIAQESR